MMQDVRGRCSDREVRTTLISKNRSMEQENSHTKKKQQSNSVNQQQRSRILTSGRKKTSASNSSRSGTYRFAAFSTSDQEAERHAPMVGNNNGRTEGNSFMQVHQTDAERLSSDDFTRRRRKMSTAS